MVLIDISEPLSPATAVWPGDTVLTRRWVMEIRAGAAVNVSTFAMSGHCGSHADAPLHYDRSGASIDEVPLEPYLGPCRVIRVFPQGNPVVVPPDQLEPARGATRVLLKTHDRHDPGRFDTGFCSLGQESAQRIVELGVKLVGIDTPSMDHFSCKDMATHRILLTGRVAILENLDLGGVTPGDYELIALPLRLVGSDASPVRAVLRTWDQAGHG
jgi:arylformamidase